MIPHLRTYIGQPTISLHVEWVLPQLEQLIYHPLFCRYSLDPLKMSSLLRLNDWYLLDDGVHDRPRDGLGHGNMLGVLLLHCPKPVLDDRNVPGTTLHYVPRHLLDHGNMADGTVLHLRKRFLNTWNLNDLLN